MLQIESHYNSHRELLFAKNTNNRVFVCLGSAKLIPEIKSIGKTFRQCLGIDFLGKFWVNLKMGREPGVFFINCNPNSPLFEINLLILITYKICRLKSGWSGCIRDKNFEIRVEIKLTVVNVLNLPN